MLNFSLYYFMITVFVSTVQFHVVEYRSCNKYLYNQCAFPSGCLDPIVPVEDLAMSRFAVSFSPLSERLWNFEGNRCNFCLQWLNGNVSTVLWKTLEFHVAYRCPCIVAYFRWRFSSTGYRINRPITYESTWRRG